MQPDAVAGATGADGGLDPPSPGKPRLTSAELHAKRVAWGKQWGQVGREIKQAHEQRGS